jgi:hypothetical protein
MKTLKMWVVITVMLAVCAPSFGYILVYNAVNRVKAIDNDSSIIVGVSVKGYLIMDINGTTGDVCDSYWLVYGKDSTATKVYTVDWPNPQLTVYGRYQSVSTDGTGGGWSGWMVTVIGKMMSKDIGLGSNKLVAYTMSVSFIVPDGGTIYGDQTLTGSGSIVLALNATKTKAANQATAAIDDVLTDITDVLDATYLAE